MMEFERHKAPKGKVYVKDGEASYVIVTPKESNIIQQYELMYLQEFLKTKEATK